MTDRVPPTDEYYYKLVSCPHQSFRDWLLTDAGCAELQKTGLPCHNETSARSNCVTWDTEGNSCEPYPVPDDSFGTLLQAFMIDPNADPATRKTNYDKFFEQIFVAENEDLTEEHTQQILEADFSCRKFDGNKIVLAVSTTATLDQTFEQNYEDGIDLYERWDEWSIQMRKSAPAEMKGTMQTSSSAW